MHRGLLSGSATSHQAVVGRAPSSQPPHGLVQPPAATASSAAGKIAGLYDLEDTLGSGHFAVVKLARHVFTGEKVAVKVIDKTKLDEVSRSHLFQEVRCMKLVQHPNVVRLYEVIDTQTKLYLILELGDGGDLYDLIMRHDQGLDEPLAKEYFRQIVRAISYCHRLHVVHRDLKPENVVFFSRLGVVKLTDFGFSNRYCPGQKLQTSCGSLAYSAPEILLGDSYDAPAVDVWSLGVILYMLVCGQAPFQEANDSETLTMIMDCKYQVPAHVTAGCQRLIASMLVREPERRATLQQIARDPWLMEGEGPQMATDCLPLVSRHQVSDADHNLIVQKMANGNIATKDEILEALDKNEYNHITATYFLLAERRLRAQRQQQEIATGGANRKRPVPATLPGVIGGTNAGQNSISSGANNVSGNNSNCLLLPPGPATVQNSLMAPRTPGDGPQRARKCSIVQEADEDDMPAVGRGGEDLSVGGGSGGHCLLSRRGSRSEGRLNLVLQERIAASSTTGGAPNTASKPAAKIVNSGTGQHNGLAARMRARALHNSKWQSESAADKGNAEKWNSEQPETTVLTDSRTVNLPLQISREKTHNENQQNDMAPTLTPPKYKTMPASAAPTISLNHIHEESVDKPENKEEKVENTFQMCVSRRSAEHDSPRHLAQTDVNVRLKQLEQKSQQLLEHRSNRRLSATEEQNVMKVSNEKVQQNSSSHHHQMEAKCDDDQPSPLRNSYADQKPMGVFPQRRARFHAKGRTASCSSSDASDDDSEGRKKRRAHRIAGAATGKPIQARRDSHDDSSDSQDPSCAHGDNNRNGGNRRTSVTNGGPPVDTSNNGNGGGGQTTNSNGSSNGKQCGGRRQHRSTGTATNGGHTARRRSGVETRLRESQSLNRITEVQEPSPAVHSIVISTTLTAQRIDNSSATNNNKTTSSAKGFGARLLQGLSGRRLSMQSTDDVRDDKITPTPPTTVVTDNNKENYTTGGRRLRVLGKYFQVHRKLCIPLPGLFQRGRMYKAQSCGSLEPSSGSVTPKLFNNGVTLPPPLGDFNRELTNALVPLVCSVHLVDITECCRMC